jgi:hypothetical protein
MAANLTLPSVIAYFGDAASCTKFEMHPIDFAFAMSRPDAAKWSLTAQSSTVIDRTKTLAARTYLWAGEGTYPVQGLLT